MGLVVELYSAQKHVVGLPARTGNLISFRLILLPDAASFAEIVKPELPNPLAQGRHIEASFVSFNIDAIAGRPFQQWITAFGEKIAMLSAQFSKHQLLLVGLQETRSRQGGRTQSGDYCRVIPDPNSLAGGDIELWFNTRIPWDPGDPLTVLRPEHATITGTGPITSLSTFVPRGSKLTS